MAGPVSPPGPAQDDKKACGDTSATHSREDGCASYLERVKLAVGPREDPAAHMAWAMARRWKADDDVAVGADEL